MGGAGSCYNPLPWFQDTSDAALVLRVTYKPDDDDGSPGARYLGCVPGETLVVHSIDTPIGLESLSWRYKDTTKRFWPSSYRFQMTRRSWRCDVRGDGGYGYQRTCVMQMASRHEERTEDNARLDVEDAVLAASYASRFMLHLSAIGREDACSLRVAVPVCCEVVTTSFPALVPVGSYCVLVPYTCTEVRKFVFDGSEPFWEIPQAFFHHAAFSSGGKHFVCDIQGDEEDDGSWLLIDPCILRADLPTISSVIGAVAPEAHVDASGKKISGDSLASCGFGLDATVHTGPTAARFEKLHPRCPEMCKAFDPHRRSCKRNIGVCGMGATCGFGGT